MCAQQAHFAMSIDDVSRGSQLTLRAQFPSFFLLSLLLLFKNRARKMKLIYSLNALANK